MARSSHERLWNKLDLPSLPEPYPADQLIGIIGRISCAVISSLWTDSASLLQLYCDGLLYNKTFIGPCIQVRAFRNLAYFVKYLYSFLNEHDPVQTMTQHFTVTFEELGHIYITGREILVKFMEFNKGGNMFPELIADQPTMKTMNIITNLNYAADIYCSLHHRLSEVNRIIGLTLCPPASDYKKTIIHRFDPY